jgi:pSer/pThr/pTyr-binding forkhead associated (FHA) protein
LVAFRPFGGAAESEVGRLVAADYVEVAGPNDRRLVPLESDRTVFGAAEDADAVLADPQVSRIHLVFERIGDGWTVRDLDSTNGTFVNGRRLSSERPVRPGDEIRLGETRLVFRSTRADLPVDRATVAGPRAPSVTPRERDVLLELCRPLATGDVFTEPASIREIAEALVVTEAAVKHHLVNLYDKFAIHDSSRRRVRLANEALTRGAISLSDINP